MSAKTNAGEPNADAGIEVAAEQWSSWCKEATTDHAGRELNLHFADRGVGEVRLADGQRFVAIEYDELGPAVAITIKYGDQVLPVRHVVAAPLQVRQHRDPSGNVDRITIADSTGRRTFLSLA